MSIKVNRTYPEKQTEHHLNLSIVCVADKENKKKITYYL